MSGFSPEGLVWAAFLGMVAGNFATSPIYRLPRREPLVGRKPYCDTCAAPLQPKDLFPIFSWLSTRGRCRYCGTGVPCAYFFVEVWATLLFMFSYVQFGFSELFIVASFGLVALIVVCVIWQLERVLSWTALGWGVALGVIFSALQHASIYPALGGGFYAGLAAATLWKLSPQRTMPVPAYVSLVALAGVWLQTDMAHYALCAAVTLAMWLLLRIMGRATFALALALGVCAVALLDHSQVMLIL